MKTRDKKRQAPNALKAIITLMDCREVSAEGLREAIDSTCAYWMREDFEPSDAQRVALDHLCRAYEALLEQDKIVVLDSMQSHAHSAACHGYAHYAGCTLEEAENAISLPEWFPVCEINLSRDLAMQYAYVQAQTLKAFQQAMEQMQKEKQHEQA